MLVSQFLDRNIPVFTPDTAVSGIYAEDFPPGCTYAAVVKDGLFIGFFSLSDLETEQENNSILVDCDLEKVEHFLKSGQHIFEVLPVFQKAGLPILPVLDEESQYEGIVSGENIITGLSSLYAFQTEGGTIVISIPAIQYSLSEISRLVEANQGKILAVITESDPAINQNFLVHLKINQPDLSRIVATFERFEYHVIEVHQTLEANSIDKDRFDQLMRYLGI